MAPEKQDRDDPSTVKQEYAVLGEGPALTDPIPRKRISACK